MFETHGPWMGRKELTPGILRMLERKFGIIACASWLRDIPVNTLYGVYMGLVRGKRTYALKRVLAQHAAGGKPATGHGGSAMQRWQFIRTGDCHVDRRYGQGRDVRTAAVDCAKGLRLHPRNPDEAFAMLQEEGFRIPDAPL